MKFTDFSTVLCPKFDSKTTEKEASYIVELPSFVIFLSAIARSSPAVRGRASSSIYEKKRIEARAKEIRPSHWRYWGQADSMSVCPRTDPIRSGTAASDRIRFEASQRIPNIRPVLCIACQEFRLHRPARVGKFGSQHCCSPIGGVRVINIT